MIIFYKNQQGEKMELRETGMAILFGFKFLSIFTNSLDKTAKDLAVNSHNIKNVQNFNVEYISEKIIEIIEEKKNIINAKIVILDILKLLDDFERRVIILKYAYGLDIDKISTLTHKSSSSVRRGIAKGLKEFSYHFINEGLFNSRIIISNKHKYFNFDFIKRAFNLAKNWEKHLNEAIHNDYDNGNDREIDKIKDKVKEELHN